MRSIFASLLLMAGIANSQQRISQFLSSSVCIHPTIEAGADPDLIQLRNTRMESDKTNLGLLNQVEREYSLPYELMVCHDQEQIHGLQLSLIMHRFEVPDQKQQEQTFEQVVKDIDRMIEESPPRRMTLIGSISDKCETTKIFEKGTIHHIKIFYDVNSVKALVMTLNNGREFSYGSPQRSGLKFEVFTFEMGKQLLGIYGQVAFDIQNEQKPDELLTIGFFKDECSALTQLYSGGRERLNKRGKKGLPVMTTVFLVVLIIIFLCAIYVLLKHRSKICKKKRRGATDTQVNEADEEGRDNAINSHQPVSALDRTPARPIASPDAIGDDENQA